MINKLPQKSVYPKSLQKDSMKWFLLTSIPSEIDLRSSRVILISRKSRVNLKSSGSLVLLSFTTKEVGIKTTNI